MEKDYVLVFGGCGLDRTFNEKKEGGYNDEPDFSLPGGKGANQAVACARAGANVKIISRLGNDKIGQTMLDNLKNNNIDTSYVEMVDGLNNDVGNIYVSLNGDNDIQRITGAINSFTPDMIDKYADIIKNAKIVVAQLKVPKEVTERLINFCYENNVPLALTTCRPDKLNIEQPGNKELIDKITYIFCNEIEVKSVFGNEDIEKIVEKYPNKLIVTLGSNGAIFNDGKKTHHIPAFNVENVIDTTGAGDTLCGNFIANIIEGESFGKSLIYGMAAATLKIQKKSAQAGMPTKKETEVFMKKNLVIDMEKNNEMSC